MKILSDYHTHTVYSHGKNTILENAIAAKNKGLTEIAITDHCLSHLFCGMKKKYLDIMRDEITEASKATGVKIYFGIESNICNYKGKIGVDKKSQKKLDIILCGFHLIVKMNPVVFFENTVLNPYYKLIHKEYYSGKFNLNKRFVRRNTTAVINALRNNDIDILTHPSRNVRVDEVAVAKVCLETQTAYELNAKSMILDEEILKKVVATGVNFVVDSDAHYSEAVGDMSRAIELIEKIVPENQILNANGKVFIPKKFRNKENLETKVSEIKKDSKEKKETKTIKVPKIKKEKETKNQK